MAGQAIVGCIGMRRTFALCNRAVMTTHTCTYDLSVVHDNHPPRSTTWGCIMAVITRIGAGDVRTTFFGCHTNRSAIVATEAGTSNLQVINFG